MMGEDKEIQDRKERMIKEQLIARGVHEPVILRAFREVPRERFVCSGDKGFAYADAPLPIGCNQTISQPYIVALMADLLEPEAEDVVLEIGSGCGYMAAIFSRIVKQVYGVELKRELADSARKNLAELGYSNIRILCEQGKELPSFADTCVDKMVVSAATEEIPKRWGEVLRDGGRLVVPEGDRSFQVLKTYRKEDGTLREIGASIPVRFVQLR